MIDTDRSRGAGAFHVLVVDDSPVEVLFLRDCLKACPPAVKVHEVTSGKEALAFLRKEGKHQDAASCDLVITDFNLPGINGLDLLKEIVADPLLCHLPVLVMTSWDRKEDIRALYQSGCSSFIAKPTNMDDLENIVKGICDYWFSVVKLPSSS